MRPEEMLESSIFDLKSTYLDLDHLTPISFAAKYGLPNFIVLNLSKLTLDETTDLLGLTNPSGLTALHFACRYGHVQAAKALIDHGSPILKTTSLRLFPIHMLFSDKNNLKTCEELFNLFLNDKTWITERTSMNETVAHLAASKGATQILMVIKAVAPALLNAKDNHSMPPLLRAVLNNQIEAAEYLLENSDVNQKNSKEQNALHIAVTSSSLEMMMAMLPHFDSSSPDNEGNSALDLAKKFEYKKKEDAMIQYDLASAAMPHPISKHP
ncbi:MAG: ankyrin repeat domain-containing protein [Chryseobacterium sp.]